MDRTVSKSVLVVSPAPYRFATRSRKAAIVLAGETTTRVKYLSPANIGRTGQWDRAGAWMDSGISIVQVECTQPRTQPTPLNQLRNLLFSYIPAMLRILMVALRSPADIVVINGPALILVGVLHKLRYRSKFILDVPERPGMLQARGSLATVVGKFDKGMLRFASRFAHLALVVTYADVDQLKSLGFTRVELVRNVPMRHWTAQFRLPPLSSSTGTITPLTVLAMGSIFEGRGYEKLIEAVSEAHRKIPVVLIVCGPGRADYKERLADLANQLGIRDRVKFEDPVASGRVSEMYLSADVGMVLYEGSDPGNDGLSNKLFECVASGRPVIASDLPENRRFVESTHVGWLADNSVSGIASALIEVYETADLADIAKHCRRVGDSTLNWESEFSPVTRVLDGK